MSDTHNLVVERLAISDVIISYATALDTRDWGLLRSILTDRVAIDYTSFDPDLDLEMDAAEWVHGVRGLAGSDATQHLSTNHRHHIAVIRPRASRSPGLTHFQGQQLGTALPGLLQHLEQQIDRMRQNIEQLVVGA